MNAHAPKTIGAPPERPTPLVHPRASLVAKPTRAPPIRAATNLSACFVSV